MRKREVGLVKARHEMPVDEYIFEQIYYPNDFVWQQRVADSFVAECKKNNEQLYLYVTGLSMALASVIRACYEQQVPLVLWHWDNKKKIYHPQHMFDGGEIWEDSSGAS